MILDIADVTDHDAGDYECTLQSPYEAEILVTSCDLSLSDIATDQAWVEEENHSTAVTDRTVLTSPPDRLPYTGI
ncbi:hypothetical protein ACOMHN_058931 [Nucella lapillus]